MKHSMSSRVLLGAALLIAGVGVAAAQGVQAGGGQRGEARANAGAQRSGGQAQVQQRQSGGAAMQNRGASARATAQTSTRASARVERPRAANTSRQATTRSVRSERPHVARTKSSNKAAIQARTDRGSAKAQRSAQRAKPAADAKARTAAQTRARSTTGQASRDANTRTETRAQAREGRANITAEQRTKLRQVVTARNVPRVNRVNFALRRGIFVPRHYHFVRVAAFPVLIDLYPQYRPYSFFVVEDEVVFVDSGRRIVDIVPLEGGVMASSGGGAAMAMETDLSPEEIREVQTVLVAEGFPLEVTGVWDGRTRDALVVFQRRHGFAATGVIDVRTVTALKLTGKISQNHIRGANRATTGRGDARQSSDNIRSLRGESPNAQSSRQGRQDRLDRSTSGQGNEQPKAAQGRNEPKADKADKAEPKAANEPKQDAQPRAEQKPAQRSTTGQGGGQERMNRPEPKQNQKY